MSKNTLILIGFAALVIVLLLFLFLKPTGEQLREDQGDAEKKSSQSTASAIAPVADREKSEEKVSVREELFEELFSTPIDFHGKVVDQNDEPISNASIKYSVTDKYSWSSPPEKSMQADENGRFRIKSNGLSLYVNVQHPKCYPKHGQSYTFQPRANSSGSEITGENPYIFKLNRMGETEPLLHGKSGSIRVPRNGTPVTVNLRTGKMDSSGSLVIQAWTEDQRANQKQYDWRCKVSVPNGGLIERSDGYDFTAPEKGYVQYDEIVMSAEMDSGWQRQVQKEYYVTLGDGTFARLKFRIIAHGDHFAVVESYVNPSGSRNLEYDPTKVVQQ